MRHCGSEPPLDHSRRVPGTAGPPSSALRPSARLPRRPHNIPPWPPCPRCRRRCAVAAGAAAADQLGITAITAGPGAGAGPACAAPPLPNWTPLLPPLPPARRADIRSRRRRRRRRRCRTVPWRCRRRRRAPPTAGSPAVPPATVADHRPAAAADAAVTTGATPAKPPPGRRCRRRRSSRHCRRCRPAGCPPVTAIAAVAAQQPAGTAVAADCQRSRFRRCRHVHHCRVQAAAAAVTAGAVSARVAIRVRVAADSAGAAAAEQPIASPPTPPTRRTGDMFGPARPARAAAAEQQAAGAAGAAVPRGTPCGRGRRPARAPLPRARRPPGAAGGPARPIRRCHRCPTTSRRLCRLSGSRAPRRAVADQRTPQQRSVGALIALRISCCTICHGFATAMRWRPRRRRRRRTPHSWTARTADGTSPLGRRGPDTPGHAPRTAQATAADTSSAPAASIPCCPGRRGRIACLMSTRARQSVAATPPRPVAQL